MSQVNTELGIPSTTEISLNQANVRSLAAVPSGQISMSNLQGKSASVALTISTNQTNLDLYTWATANGYPGSGAVQVTIAPGVYIYSTTTPTAGLTIPASFGAGNLTLVNNGFIAGKGGAGTNIGPSTTPFAFPSNPGGPALSISTPIILTNNSYIGGGGGGGGTASRGIGAGGAGGGNGNGPGGVTTGAYTGGTGANGPGPTAYSGGAGGSVFPGLGGNPISNPAGGQISGLGGGTGGSGTSVTVVIPAMPPIGRPYSSTSFVGGGGGGWGAAGGNGLVSNAKLGTPAIIGNSGAGGPANTTGGTGSQPGAPGTQFTQPGGAGGRAINLNGNTITYPAVGTIWGSVA
jgi:hypothetical protein